MCDELVARVDDAIQRLCALAFDPGEHAQEIRARVVVRRDHHEQAPHVARGVGERSRAQALGRRLVKRDPPGREVHAAHRAAREPPNRWHAWRRLRLRSGGVIIDAMGQRSPTETVTGIVCAFLERRTWAQADLARKLEMTTPALRKRLRELEGPLRLTHEEDHPHVYWSVPKDWFPGGLLVKRDEIPQLLRMLARLPRGKARDRMLDAFLARVPGLTKPVAIAAPEASAREEQHVSAIEDAAESRNALRFRYFTASRGVERARVASVHRVFPGPPARFVATCHQSGTLKWFRVDNVTEARAEPSEPYRAAEDARVDAFVAESLDAFHEDGPARELSLLVREPESRWVERNLLPGMVAEPAGRGVRVRVNTTALDRVARWAVGLGGAAECETPELAARVAEIARAALRAAG